MFKFLVGLFGFFVLTTSTAYGASSNNTETLRDRSIKEGWTFQVDTSAIKQRSFGFVPSQKNRNSKQLLQMLDKLSDDLPALPSSWDWRDKGVVGAVKDQGDCGSCWAFASASIVESAYGIKYGDKISLAEQQLVSCDTRFQGCNGGDFASDFYVTTGANYEADYLYTAKNTKCNKKVAQHEKVVSMTVIGETNAEPTVEQVKQAIYTYGPVSTAVDASADSFSAYTSGIYNDCGGTNLDHLVVLVGWDDSTQSWIMRNSWASDWGESGYMRIAYYAADGKTKCDLIGSQIGYVQVP